MTATENAEAKPRTPVLAWAPVPQRTITPNPIGRMPINTLYFEPDAGLRFRRIVLTWTEEARVEEQYRPTTEVFYVKDAHSGQVFEVTLGTPCGAKCRCGAEARWVLI